MIKGPQKVTMEKLVSDFSAAHTLDETNCFYFHWVFMPSTHLTDSVKSPGLDLLGLAKKLPSTLLFKSNSSASIPDTLGWNHLEIKKCLRKREGVQQIKTYLRDPITEPKRDKSGPKWRETKPRCSRRVDSEIDGKSRSSTGRQAHGQKNNGKRVTINNQWRCQWLCGSALITNWCLVAAPHRTVQQ